MGQEKREWRVGQHPTPRETLVSRWVRVTCGTLHLATPAPSATALLPSWE